MIYEVNLILFSPTQCPDYKQLFIVTYSNKRVMGPHKSTSWYWCCQWAPWWMKDWVNRMVNINVKHLPHFIDLSLWHMPVTTSFNVVSCVKASYYYLVNGADDKSLSQFMCGYKKTKWHVIKSLSLPACPPLIGCIEWLWLNVRNQIMEHNEESNVKLSAPRLMLSLAS